YPWYAAWDLAFHMIPFARLDPEFAKHQLVLLLREWYMHPNGQIPAYEFSFGDVNPPVHAWACWRVYKLTGLRAHRDRLFLQLAMDGTKTAVRVRSMVGLVPLIACEIVETETLKRLPDFAQRMEWFIQNRSDLVRHISMCEVSPDDAHRHRLLALPRRERLERVLRYVLDESEFLSAYGIRSVSKVHQDRPYVLQAGGQEYRVDY